MFATATVGSGSERYAGIENLVEQSMQTFPEFAPIDFDILHSFFTERKHGIVVIARGVLNEKQRGTDRQTVDIPFRR